MNSSHRVRVLGRDVLVRTTATAEQVREIESFINGAIDELQASMKSADTQLVAIMALLNLAESCLQQSRENSRLNGITRERITRMVRRIDETMKQA